MVSCLGMLIGLYCKARPAYTTKSLRARICSGRGNVNVWTLIGIAEQHRSVQLSCVVVVSFSS